MDRIRIGSILSFWPGAVHVSELLVNVDWLTGGSNGLMGIAGLGMAGNNVSMLWVLLAVTGLVGERVDDLDERIRSTLRGTSSCTHLNDVLLSLADLWTLIPADGGPPWPT